MDAPEAIESLSAPLKERLSHPFLGAFLLVWPIANWDLLLVLAFDSRPIVERLAFIRQTYWIASHLFWIPALSALVFVLIAPWTRYIHYLYCSTPDFLRQRREIQQEQRASDEKAAILELKAQLEARKNAKTQRDREELQKRIEAAQKRHDSLERSIRDLEARRAGLKRRSPGELASDLYPSAITQEDIRTAIQMLYRRIRELRVMEKTEVEAPGQLYLSFDADSKQSDEKKG